MIGFLTNELIAEFDAFWKKLSAEDWGYSCELKCLILSHLLREADTHRSRNMANNKQHCIHQLLPPTKILPMKLRHSHYLFALPQCRFNLHKRSLVLRSLFDDAY